MRRTRKRKREERRREEQVRHEGGAWLRRIHKKVVVGGEDGLRKSASLARQLCLTTRSSTH
jgi:hypothetical protein